MVSTKQKKSIEEQVFQYLSELITLQLTAAIHGTNKSVRACIKRRIPQLEDYPFVVKELRKILQVPLTAAEVDFRWRQMEEIQGGEICFED